MQSSNRRPAQFNRIKAILAYGDEYGYSEIAKILLLDDEIIRRHIEDYLKKKKLNPENGGSESKSTIQNQPVIEMACRLFF